MVCCPSWGDRQIMLGIIFATCLHMADKKLTTLEIWDGSIFLCRTQCEWLICRVDCPPASCVLDMDSLSTLYSGPFWALCARPDIFPEFSSASASPRTGGPEEWVWSVVRDMDMVGVLLYYRCHHRGHWVLVWWLEPLAPLSCLGFNLIFHLGTTALHPAIERSPPPTSATGCWVIYAQLSVPAVQHFQLGMSAFLPRSVNWVIDTSHHQYLTLTALITARGTAGWEDWGQVRVGAAISPAISPAIRSLIVRTRGVKCGGGDTMSLSVSEEELSAERDIVIGKHICRFVASPHTPLHIPRIEVVTHIGGCQHCQHGYCVRCSSARAACCRPDSRVQSPAHVLQLSD